MNNRRNNNIFREVVRETAKTSVRNIVNTGLDLTKYYITNKIPKVSVNDFSNKQEDFNRIISWLSTIDGFADKFMTQNEVKYKGTVEYKYILPFGTFYHKYNNCILIVHNDLLGRKDVINTYSGSGMQVSNVGQDTRILEVKIIGSGYKNIINEINNHKLEKSDDYIKVRMNGYNELILKRDINTVFSDSKNEIVDFINNFKRLKEYHSRVRIPYRTGLLLYGPSGTGKTTIVNSIASFLGYKVLSVHILDIKNLRVPEDTIVLFEDIDRDIDRLKEQNKDDVGMSTLLNFIDGINSATNVIFIATTNHIDILDEALIRHGRFNKHIKMDNICEKTARDMCVYLETDPDFILKGETFPINPAYLQSKCIEFQSRDNS